jgi:leucyl-tRNA synthetase
MQRNWIGRSEGAEIDFAIADATEKIMVFTTRHDTLFGATYLVLAPEHPLVDKATTAAQRGAVDEYRRSVAAKSEIERTDLAKSKTGVFTGGYAVNPVNSQKIPIWIADYVLASYGTGAIMGVPAHDERDHEFALKYQLPIVQVLKRPEGSPEFFAGESEAINSEFLNGLPTAEAKKKMASWLEEKGMGRTKVQYKLRDWLFSRQRYWGEPFPIIWKKDGKHYPVAESDLPVLLPDLEDYKPSVEGLAPLSKAKSWVELPDGARRETNTMPNWAGSCWYFIRYCDPKNTEKFIDPEIERYWFQPRGIDLYIGGAEHAVLHLLYARFWHKVLFDLGHVSTSEPFHKLVNQGMILGEDNQKMSKSLGNVINPDDVVAEYGADSLRLFEMYMGPLTAVKPWSTKGVNGVYRFLGRVWRLVMEEDQAGNWVLSPKLSNDTASPEIQRRLHETIKKVTEDIEGLQFNTAIAQLMILVNDLTKEEKHPRATLETLVLLLAPFAPHIAEELWAQLGHNKTLAYEPWPKFDEIYLQTKTVEMVVQVNGKVRSHLTTAVETTQADVEKQVKALPEMSSWLEGKTIAKVIFVPKKLINFVVT